MSEETAVIPPIFSQKDLLGRGWSKRLLAQLVVREEACFG
jgi:hypothetical protein